MHPCGFRPSAPLITHPLHMQVASKVLQDAEQPADPKSLKLDARAIVKALKRPELLEHRDKVGASTTYSFPTQFDRHTRAQHS